MRRLLAFVAVLHLAVLVVAEDKPFPKPLKADEKVKTAGWFGRAVLPKRYENDIRIGNWKDGKQETWTPYSLVTCVVREDRDGFLRVFDGRREGWVSKDDMVPAEDAAAWWDKAVNANPSAWYVLCLRGTGRAHKGEYDSAIKDFDEVIRLWPEDGQAYSGRGLAWIGKKEYDKAIADYTEAIQLDPKYALAFSHRAKGWATKKEYDKALTDYTEAIQHDPKDANCFIGLAWLHATCPVEKLRDGKKAVEEAKKAIDLMTPSVWYCYSTLAAAYAEVGDFELAVAEQRKAIEQLKAEKNPDKDYLRKAEARLELYWAKKPYRDE